MTAKKILIIENIHETCKAYKEIIENHYNKNSLNIIVKYALSGEAGLIKCSSFKPDLVLLDIGLEDENISEPINIKMDGFECLARIKKSHPTIKVIMITVHESAEMQNISFGLGAIDYLMKPVFPDFLLGKIEVHL